MKRSKRTKHTNQQGFTIIEMLVVVFIFAILAVAIAGTTKQIILANTRLRSIQTAQSQGQEAIQFLTKQIRMSEYTGGACNPCETIELDWRKAEGSNGYVTQTITVDEATVAGFFQGSTVDKFRIFASGTDSNNRVIMTWELQVGKGANRVIIPMQTTASLRSFNVN